MTFLKTFSRTFWTKTSFFCSCSWCGQQSCCPFPKLARPCLQRQLVPALSSVLLLQAALPRWLCRSVLLLLLLSVQSMCLQLLYLLPLSRLSVCVLSFCGLYFCLFLLLLFCGLLSFRRQT